MSNKNNESSLEIVAEYSETTMFVFLLVVIATAYLFGLVRKGFMPDSDTGQILIFTEAAQTISFINSIIRDSDNCNQARELYFSFANSS